MVGLADQLGYLTIEGAGSTESTQDCVNGTDQVRSKCAAPYLTPVLPHGMKLVRAVLSDSQSLAHLQDEAIDIFTTDPSLGGADIAHGQTG